VIVRHVDEEYRLKIRIFALAKELDLDSKDLIQACTEVGLTVKSSPLASISPEERDMVLAHIKSRKAGGPAKAAKAAEAPVLSREPVPERTKLKPIRTLGTPVAKTGTRRPEDQDELSSPEEVAAPEPTLEPVEAVAVAPEPAPAPEIKTAPVLEKKPAKAKVEPVAPPPVVEAPVSETSAESEDDPGTAAAHAVPEKPAAPATAEAPAAPAAVPPASRSRITPMSRPEQPSPLREMKPVGSVRDMAPRGTMPARTAEPPISRDRDKGARRGPALPTMAMPSFKAPSPTKAEGPVQKPDLKLTGEMLRDSGKGKIADIMRKNKEAGTKRKPGDPLPTAESARAGKLPTGGMEEIREARRQKRTKTRGSDELDAQEIIRQKRNRKSISAELKTEATVTLPITMRGLSELLGRPVSKLMGLAMKSGKMVAINDSVDEEIVLEIGMEFGIDIKIVREDDVETELKAWLDRPNEDFGVPLIERAPIVTILGHVDHGKTTLVDTIRKSNVAAGEAGGITQHIAAYQVEHHGKKLTFVDTPGHAAFSQMRARGANVTDIVVLVVAANDGVMPQTIECISHARAAGVPIVVALNKIDLPGINEQKVLTELSQQGLYPTEWGGDTEVVRISGLTGDGVDNLLETLLLTAELNNYTAPADIPADGVCLESFRDEGRGPMAWCMVRRGTLKIGDTLLCGSAYGRVRAMYNDKGQEVREAGPSTPVKVAGLSDVPGTGYHFFAVDDLDLAVQVAEERKQKGRFDMLSSRGGPKTLEQYFAEKEGNLRELPLVVKADTQGSIEAIRFELNKFDHAEVKIRILHEAVGGVNESDVYLAASSGAIVVAFGVIPDDNAVALASKEGVEIRRYSIIYNVADDIRNALEGLLAPEVVSVQTGRAIVLRTFVISKAGVIAGCRVLSGLIERSNRVNVIREQKVLNSYNIASLKREKEDVREVRDGLECGIRLEGFNDVKEGDLLECFRIEERKRTLDE
jgi:translation initiation factor IF-2